MRTLAISALLFASTMTSGGALAQVDDSGADNLESPAALRCSALAEVDAANQPTAIAFIAGYGSGERDAITFATVGSSTEAANEGAAPAGASNTAAGATQPAEGGQQSAQGGQQSGQGAQQPAQSAQQPAQSANAQATQPQAPRRGGPSAAILPNIPVEAILAACAQSPDSRILDIITAQGISNSQ